MRHRSQSPLRALFLSTIVLLLGITVPGQTGGSAGRAASAPSVAEVLAHVREAVRYEKLRAQAGGFVGTGTAHYNGVDAAYELAFDANGRFAGRIDGPLGNSAGFDGTRGWTVDWSGMPGPLELEDLDEEQFVTWVYTGHWLAGNGPLDVAVLESETDAKQVALTLSMRTGPLVATLFVDRSTWLPTSIRRRSDSGEEVIRIEQYREVDGFRFPFKLTRTLGRVTDTYELKSLEHVSGDEAARRFAPVTSRPDDTTFRAGVSPSLEVKRARSGHLLVHPVVDGKDLGWFILDSGAGAMVIDKKAADEAKMTAIGEVHVNGVGGSETSRFRMGRTFELGPVVMRNPRYVELDLQFISNIFGIPIGGICGYDLFARAVVELDLAKPSVRLFDPSSYTLDRGNWQEVVISHKHPHVRARFEGEREEIFRLDTGSDRTVTFHSPAVRRYKMLDGRTVGDTQAGGVGGSVDMKSGTVEWFEFGGHRFESPEVEFAITGDGAFGDDYTAGNIGTGFLAAFTIVFDYPHKRMAFMRR